MKSADLPQARRLYPIDDFGIGYSSLSALADITAMKSRSTPFITDIHKRPRSQGICGRSGR